MATMISCASLRARKPSLLTRMVYQVGWPWMLEGNRFFPETGMPILNSARTSVELDVWLPDPLTVATVMVKSLTISPLESGWTLAEGERTASRARRRQNFCFY